jgi:predicted acyltransferase (DUF342 family)
VSVRSDPLDRLAIPDGTTAEEHDLVTHGDVVVGGQSVVEFGVRGRNVFAGERVRFDGDIEANGNCRLDMWCDVEGNVLVGGDAYLGERVHVGGQLMVSGDLDIGDDVDIEEGFEANGWIVIRNPMPTIVFIFMYLTQLLRMGEDEAAEEVVGELRQAREREHDPVIIPRGSRVSDDAWRVSTPATIGDGCRLHGNVRAKTLDVGRDSEMFGSLRAKGDLTVGEATVVHGDVTTRNGHVTIAADAHVRGDVSCEELTLHDDAEVDGSIRARGKMSIARDEARPSIGDVEEELETDETDGAGDEAEEGDADATPDPVDWESLTPAFTRVDGEAAGEAAIADADAAERNEDAASGSDPEHDSIGDDTAMEETLGDAIAEAER